MTRRRRALLRTIHRRLSFRHITSHQAILNMIDILTGDHIDPLEATRHDQHQPSDSRRHR